MRLFVAVEISDALKDKIEDIQKLLLEPAVKLVERPNLHVTIQFIGEVPDDKAKTIVAALRRIKMAPFEIEIGGIGTFPPGDERINIVWVDCSGKLAELAANVEGVLKPFGFRQDKEFVSHITVARVKQKPAYLARRIEDVRNSYIGKQLVDRFVLKRSTLTPQGPIYEDLEVYALAK